MPRIIQHYIMIAKNVNDDRSVVSLRAHFQTNYRINMKRITNWDVDFRLQDISNKSLKAKTNGYICNQTYR